MGRHAKPCLAGALDAMFWFSLLPACLLLRHGARLADCNSNFPTPRFYFTRASLRYMYM